MSDDLYARLNVPRDADSETIKKAYRKLTLTHHPDKGGDVEEFKKIQEAYSVLSDDTKRQIYDQTGSIDGEDMGGMHGGMPFDIGSLFGMFGGGPFGMGGMPGMPGGMGRGPRVRRPKGPVKVQEVPLGIADFYHGKNLRVKFDRQKFCEGCKGEGFTSFSSCGQCQGSGTMSRMAMMGPGMMVQMQGPCEGCKGEGKKGSGSCSKCYGKKFQTQEKILDVNIQKGMKAGDVLIFENECSDHPDFERPGDVHFVLQEADEEIEWKRDGNNLKTTVSISLQESLLGCTKTVKNHPGFPDGFNVVIPAGTVNQEVLTSKGNGMPIRNSTEKGDALITIMVQASQREKEILERNKVILESLFL